MNTPHTLGSFERRRPIGAVHHFVPEAGRPQPEEPVESPVWAKVISIHLNISRSEEWVDVFVLDRLLEEE